VSVDQRSADISLWRATAPVSSERPQLGETVDCDVAVLGAGIAGLTTAYLLALGGADVVVVEAATIGEGTTGNTTAKVSSAHGMCYAPLRRRHGPQTAAAYAAINEAAIDWIEQTAQREGIDCDWRRRDNYTYSVDAARREDLEREADASRAAGLAAELVDATPLPFDVAGAVRAASQAEFHPVKWLLELAAAAERAGARVFERTRACEVASGSPCVVRTPKGAVHADRVVITTHYPTLDRGLYFARLIPQRSYCVALRAPSVPDGMFLSIDSPTRSVRAHLEASEELLIVGGEGHKVGQGGDTRERYAALERWAAEHFGATDVLYRWSAQDPMPPDELPYVGALVPRSERLFVATGFRKWGMTNGTAAGAVLRDLLLGRDVGPGAIFAANRFDPLAAGPTLVKENASVAKHFVADRLARPVAPEEIAVGEGAIVRRSLRHAAAYRDDAGALHVFGSACTHLGCQLRFNQAERSWDCPCHGSRFDATDGRVLEGPAVTDLKPMETDMDQDALATYLNDHLSGATLGVDHARQIAENNEGTELGEVMTLLHAEIEQDRDTLIDLMERLDISQNPVKKAGAWIMEKAGRPKFDGTTSGDEQLGTYLALETMSLGVAGKLSLWEALNVVRDQYPPIAEIDLAALIQRAKSQRATLEEQRLRAAEPALT